MGYVEAQVPRSMLAGLPSMAGAFILQLVVYHGMV
jgi:hypothetical protein